MPSKPQPFRLPQRFDSPTLAKFAIPGEPTVIVRAVGMGSTAPFEYSDRNGRQAIFRYEREYDAHVLKVPASVWNHNKGFMAHELMDQRRLPHPLVVTVEVPTAEATSPIKGLLDAMKADPEYAWGWHCNIAMSAHNSGAGPHSACNRGAALFLSLLSDGAVDTTAHPAYAQTQKSPKSQDGQAAKSSGDAQSAIVELPMAIRTQNNQIGRVVDFFPFGRIGEVSNGSPVADFDMLVISTCGAFFSRFFQNTPREVAQSTFLAFRKRPFGSVLQLIAANFPTIGAELERADAGAKYESLGALAASAVDCAGAWASAIIEMPRTGTVAKKFAANVCQAIFLGAQDGLSAMLADIRIGIVGGADFSGLSEAAIAAKIYSVTHAGSITSFVGGSNETEGSSPSPATISPEMDASGNSEETSDVVVGQVSEQPGASSTFSGLSLESQLPDKALYPHYDLDGKLVTSPDSSENVPTVNAVPDEAPVWAGSIMHKDKPMFSAAWDMLQSPMRLKELAAALETDPDTLKTALQEPLSTVELGHAGWVKRREPQA